MYTLFFTVGSAAELGDRPGRSLEKEVLRSSRFYAGSRFGKRGPRPGTDFTPPARSSRTYTHTNSFQFSGQRRCERSSRKGRGRSASSADTRASGSYTTVSENPKTNQVWLRFFNTCVNPKLRRPDKLI